MTMPDWTRTDDKATHYDTVADVFCKKDAWYVEGDGGGVWQRAQTETWDINRYTPRPTETEPSEWIDGWPPVGWQGECSWGGNGKWFNCMVIPGISVVVQGSAGDWNVVNDLKEYNYEFREVQNEVDADRADLEDLVTRAIASGLTTNRIVDCIIEKGYRLVKD